MKKLRVLSLSFASMMNLEAKKTDIIENILYKFCLLIKTNIELLSFYCNSQEIDPKLKIK